MRKIAVVICLLFVYTLGVSQSGVRKLPVVNVKTLSGKTVSTGKLSNDGKPIIISFWATWCKPCVRELNAIQEVYEDWTDETGVKLIAVSIDDSRNTAKVGPFVNGKGWDYEIVLDANRDFSRAMSVNTVPHTFLLNGKGEIVWQHTTYADGDEDELYELVQKVAAGKSID
ncbi:MAG: TlpA family protein disulfide reductase [Flavobacteriales bacterium]|nr:TlpA family protein disulfide reductase [Flavobacteriales bacterium]